MVADRASISDTGNRVNVLKCSREKFDRAGNLPYGVCVCVERESVTATVGNGGIGGLVW